MTAAYTENAYEMFEEDIAGVFFSEHTKTWWRIRGPHGLLDQAYLNEFDAREVLEKLNSKPYFNPQAFCEEVREKNAELD